MKKSILSYAVILTILFSNAIKAQNSRYSDFNQIGWASFNFGIKVSKKLDVTGDYQLRRDELGLRTQQHQVRAGLLYNINKNASVLVGYSFIETFPFGDDRFPLSPSRLKYPEHRIYEQLIFKDQIGRVELTHRYRLEQRWVAFQPTEYSHVIEERRRSNRFRYLLRIQVPLNGPTLEEKESYFAAYNEIFVSFGSVVKYNMFDQNRSALLFGHKFSKAFRIEAGPYAQIAQLGALRQVSGYSSNKTIMQYNLGYIINAYFNFDLTKKETAVPPTVTK